MSLNDRLQSLAQEVHLQLERSTRGERRTGPVSVALDDPETAEREQQRQLLRKDAPDLERV